VQSRDVVIIGAGPAGLAAAIQLRRYGVEALVLEKSVVGGLLNNAHVVENYPGFPDGIEGPELVGLMQSHAEAFSVEIRCEEVSALRGMDDSFEVETAGEFYRAHTVIIASGTKALRPNGLVIDEEVAGKVYYEVFPMRKLHGRTIAIVGAGDAAFDYSLNLGRQNEIVLLNRGDSVKALELLVERVRASSAIRYEEHVRLDMIGCGSDGCVKLEGRQDGRDYEIDVDAVVFAIGREGQFDFLAADLQGEIENLYFIGDVKNGRFRQTAIAVADGIRAAMKINEKLQEQRL